MSEYKKSPTANYHDLNETQSNHTFNFIDNRATAIAQRKLQTMINGGTSATTKQLMSAINSKYSANTIHDSEGNQKITQLFRINGYTDYNGYLASEPGASNSEKVQEMIDIYSQGGIVGNGTDPIKAARDVELVPTQGGDWDYDQKDEVDNVNPDDIITRDVITNGHHRMTAYVEVFDRVPLNIVDDHEAAIWAYNWNHNAGSDSSSNSSLSQEASGNDSPSYDSPGSDSSSDESSDYLNLDSSDDDQSRM